MKSLRCKILTGLLVGLTAGLAASCAGPDSSADRRVDAALAGADSYAWTARGAPPELSGRPETDDRLVLEIQRAADGILAERGWRLVDETEADVLIAPHLGVEVKTQDNDPYFSFYSAIQYEEGSVLLEFLDPVSRDTLWWAQAVERIRDSGLRIGVHNSTYTPTDEPRRWPIESMVDDILEPVPERMPLQNIPPGGTRRRV